MSAVFAVQAERVAVADACYPVCSCLLAVGRVMLRFVRTATVCTAYLVRLYLAYLRTCLVSKEVASSTDDQRGSVYEFYCPYLSAKHWHWLRQDSLCGRSIWVRKGESDCAVPALDAVWSK